MFTISKNLSSSSIFVYAFFLASGVTLAHFNSAADFKINEPQNDGLATKKAKDLQKRLGLTEVQTSKIGNILLEYRNDVLIHDNPSVDNQSYLQQDVYDKIISLLDENQKSAFAQIKKMIE